ncbi:hypothetical protein ACL00X_14260 [Aeromonas diversa]|uniref:hypothetical protein n=1 Tax=Aeromonas diversa TaxID=502790 RepID=UPI00399F2C18
MKLTKRVALPAAAILMALTATAARAEEDAAPMPLVQLEVNTTSADTYLLYFGRAFTKMSKGVLEEYRWGGTSCGSRVLSDAEVALLQGALDNANVRVAFRYQEGQGATKCVVGFALVRKGFVEHESD